MHKPIRIFFIITAVFLLVMGLAYYALYEKYQDDLSKINIENPDDPLVIAAKDRARETMDTLFVLFRQHKKQTYVRVPVKNKQGNILRLWSQLITLKEDYVTARLPGENLEIRNRAEQYSFDQVDDWQITLPDSTILGGYTNQARLMKESEQYPDKADAIRQQLKRFQDPL